MHPVFSVRPRVRCLLGGLLAGLLFVGLGAGAVLADASGHCAEAVGGFTPVAETSDEQWDRILATNLTAIFRLTREALPQLTDGGGHVVMISSLAGQNPGPGMAAYGGSKAALDYFAHCLMMEVRHHGVNVTTIAPGSVATSFPDRTGHAGAMKSVSQGGVACANALRHQLFHGLANELRARVAEELFAPGVGQLDDPGLVGHHQSVGSKFEHASEELFGLA